MSFDRHTDCIEVSNSEPATINQSIDRSKGMSESNQRANERMERTNERANKRAKQVERTNGMMERIK
jgi:hypothetical protein